MKITVSAISELLVELKQVALRFPLVLLSALVGVGSAITLLYLEETDPGFWLIMKLALFGFWGISYFIASEIMSESLQVRRATKWFFKGVFPALYMLYFLLMDLNEQPVVLETIYRFSFFVLASHLLVSVAPYIINNDTDSFWMYNKTLFLRALLSALYSGVLFIGLTIALLAMDALLGLELDDELILALFFVMSGIFTTVFFLAGIPENPQNPGPMEFPKGLRVFTQFVLIPLVTVYILILYTYMGKIIVQWELPDGWVSNLILVFSVAGILSLLLLYPVRDSMEQRWVKWYSRGYYLALVPLILLLMVSIYVRIDDYGVTVNRYLVATLAVWLTGIVAYFIGSEKRDIRMIPLSLFVTVLLISGGPLGAFAVSERSQMNRFEHLMARNDRLDAAGMVTTEGERPPASELQEISSVVFYITEHHGYQILEDYTDESLTPPLSDDEEPGTPGAYEISKHVMSVFGLPYLNTWQDPEDQLYTRFTLMAEEHSILDVEGYSRWVRDIRFRAQGDSVIAEALPSDWMVSGDLINGSLTILRTNEGQEYQVDLHAFLEERLKSYDPFGSKIQSIPAEELILKLNSKEDVVMLAIRNISGTFGEQVKVEQFTADLLYR